MTSRVERYLNHLDSVFQQEPTFQPMQSLRGDLNAVIAIAYQEVPEPGYITGFTYGLSLVDHPDWTLGRPELSITVASSDLAWPLAIAAIAERLRGVCPFRYGDTIRFGERISQESDMDGFLVFAPSIFDDKDLARCDVGDELPINIAGMYPVYSSEIELLRVMPLDQFWQAEQFDVYDVNRRPVS